MPTQLIAYATHAFIKTHPSASTSAPILENALSKIFVLIRAQTGHDFSQYKPSTINRRIERRMAVHQIESIDAYVKLLLQTPGEVDLLFHDLLIGVTSFFRDPSSFKSLTELVIPKLIHNAPPGSTLRIWTPGCSTGEEAYSLAILLHEQLDLLKQNMQVQIFATDIDCQAIAIARTGIYPTSILPDISPERLARFFSIGPDGSSYRINKVIRDMLVFSEQDLIKDPPFSKLHLISCRNLLIYMGSELQKKIIPLFHYSLNPGGYLFLGTSETVGEFGDLFTALDPRIKLYQRKENFRSAQRAALPRYLPPSVPPITPTLHTLRKKHYQESLSLRELTEQVLLQQATLTGALINHHGDILYLHGRTGRYLEPPPGEAGINNILKMARDGLRHELTLALHKAVSNREIVHTPGVRVKTNGHFTTVNLSIQPVSTTPAALSETSLYLVILEEPEPAGDNRPEDGDTPTAATATPEQMPHAAAEIANLKQELLAKEDYLQSINEELETSNEELKSANEELQSVNEEMQSANEELETSKEELQSINEELATVNSELQIKVADLSRANNDMSNLLAGTGLATIFLDHDLRILRFTPTATKIINLIPSDVGRPLSHIASNLVGYDQLLGDARAVLDTLIPKELEVQSTDGTWYLMSLRPYRTLENVIEGAVITFTDISEARKGREAFRRLAVVVLDSYDAITLQGLDGRILAWNPQAEKLYGWSEAEALSMNILDMTPEPQRQSALSTVKTLGRDALLKPCPMQRITKDGKLVNIMLTATPLMDHDGKLYAIATTERAR